MDELLHRLERSAALDRLADPIDTVSRPLLGSERASRLLSGAWMGHRLHPMLTDAVIGAWMSASALDALGGEQARASSRTLVGLGIVSSVPTVAAGLHDWLDFGTPVRRAGVVHAAANAVGLGLQVASWAARRHGRHGRGAWLSLAAIAATGAGGYLGGHLTYVLGAGVERTAFEEAPTEWSPATRAADLDGGHRAVEVAGIRVLLVEQDGAILALADTCNHAGCSLAQGTVADGTVTCTCHGSRFRLSDGKTLSGPAAASQPTYEARVRDGIVEVRQRPTGASPDGRAPARSSRRTPD